MRNWRRNFESSEASTSKRQGKKNQIKKQTLLVGGMARQSGRGYKNANCVPRTTFLPSYSLHALLLVIFDWLLSHVGTNYLLSFSCPLSDGRTGRAGAVCGKKGKTILNLNLNLWGGCVRFKLERENALLPVI